MGFGVKWRKWIKECISTARLAVLINGSPTEDFSMERGLRQGDPLSPFLFIIAAEGLSSLLKKAEEVGDLSGVEWVKNGDRISHLQFADDTILFCKADEEEVDTLKRILMTFQTISGLTINLKKSSCIGIGMKEIETEKFASIFGCPVGKLPMQYLGIPVGVNPGKLKSWEPILEKVKKKLAPWKSCHLSMAGRLILIKAVLCSLPLYYASIYKMPIRVALELEKLQRNFLWGRMEGGRKIHYVKWEKVKRPRRFGGLEIQGMAEKNMVLLAKWWWRLISTNEGLWRRMVIEKYKLHHLFNLDSLQVNPSRTSKSWRDIFKIVKGNEEVGTAFRNGLRLKMGKGNIMKFWGDKWSGDTSLRTQFPKLFSLSVQKEATVSEMGQWTENGWQWTLKFRRNLYLWEETEKETLERGLSHLQPKEEGNDQITWAFSQDGIFKTNSLMKAAVEIKANKEKWQKPEFQVWLGLAPPKVELLIWRLLQESLPTKDILQKKGVIKEEQNLICHLCEVEKETTDHIMSQCSWSWQVWTRCLRWWGIPWVFPASAKSVWESWVVRRTSKTYKRFWKTICYAVFWSIWEERNRRCFKDQKRSAEIVGDLIKVRVAWWIKFRNRGSPYSISTIQRCIEEVRSNT